MLYCNSTHMRVQACRVATQRFINCTKGQRFKNSANYCSVTVSQDPKVGNISSLLEHASQFGKTENDSWTYNTSGSARLNFFFEVLPSTDQDTFQSLLAQSWNEHPDDTLKLLAFTRDVRNGKSDRNSFYKGSAWLFANHPKSLIENMKFFPRFGYWKDLLEILAQECRGSLEDLNRNLFSQRQIAKEKRSNRWYELQNRTPEDIEKIRLERATNKESRLAANAEKIRTTSEQAQNLRIRKKQEREEIKRAKMENPLYAALVEEVARVYAQQLTIDMKRMRLNKTISLAAKWAPSLQSTFDKHTPIVDEIAKLLFPVIPDESPEAHLYRARECYRRQVYKPLRAYDQVIETFMTSNRWGEIPYKRVPSVCMQGNQNKFWKHDSERFSEYLSLVSQGKATIASGALLPHQMVSKVLYGQEADLTVTELQWKDYCEKLRKSGSLNNSLAVCDVSGSMCGLPMEVAISLSILVSELNDPPFRDYICTFSKDPTFHKLTGDTLTDRVNFVRNMNWGMNTDFVKVFRGILNLAQQHNLPPDQMIKRLYVFSDMQFDAASSTPYETDHMLIKKTFEAAGYPLPQIVYWNLGGTMSKPVTKEDKDVALISGFSGQLLKLFMDSGIIDPMSLMFSAIHNSRYNVLHTVD